MIPAIDVPLRTDDDGVIRVGQSRVTLQTVVADFNRGASAEEIAHRYPVLNLSQVYLVIGYCLENRQEVDEYVSRQRQLAAEARNAYEADHPNDPLRQRLLAQLESQRRKTGS
ncbi:MAG: DUF433 domain-containing protein [Anaerolineaceae bacterium]|nr:DUF433 domain-containing protein [Anaerolineaceae bacterium]